jgi:hypothetical protein
MTNIFSGDETAPAIDAGVLIGNSIYTTNTTSKNVPA